MPSTPDRPLDRGQVLVVFALGLIVFLSIAALVIDFGYWLQERRTLQNDADAAALAGVNHLRPPLSSQKDSDAVFEALADLNRTMNLQISNMSAAAAAAASPSGFSRATGAGYSGPDTIYVTAPPNPDCGGPGTYVGNERAITVAIRHQSARFFSRILTAGNPDISVCATAASTAGGYAVAVLAPAGGSRSSQLTFNLSGANTTVNITGGDVVVNSTYAAQGNPCSNPPCNVQPALVHFTTEGNVMNLWNPAPQPPTWTISPAQITDPAGNYLAPRKLNAKITIPGWGPGAWVNNDASPGTTYDPTAAPLTYSGPAAPTGATAGNCTDPTAPTVHGLRPGNYSSINLANGQRLWLCPGVFHIVSNGGGGTQHNLVMANGGVLAGQGVTLAFESNAGFDSVGGSAVYLNSAAAGGTPSDAPWSTGDTRHDVPIAIWVRPIADCNPLAATPCTDASSILKFAGGSGIDEVGIIYGPTDNITLSSANTTQASAAGEIWAWTLTYTGQATLNQVFAGPDVSFPVLVQ